MANLLTKAWSYLTQPYPGVVVPERAIEQKFTMADQTQDWRYIEHLWNGGGIRPDASGGDANSAVFACLRALAFGSIEPPLAVYRKDTAHGGELELQPDAPLQAFLDDPNPDLDTLEIRFWTAWAKHVDGNAYLVKVRSGNPILGNVIQYWPVSPMVMRPATDKGTTDRLITHYLHDVGSREPERIPRENVMHFRFGVDDRDMRKGMSPLKKVIREVCTDEEATKFEEALLRNFGIPGLVVQPPLGASLSAEQATDVKRGVAQAFGGENRGGVGVLTGGATMTQFGFSPEQLAMDVLHGMPETRICAVMGVHPAVAGLMTGIEQSANFASLKELFSAFTERTLAPHWRMDEAKWNKQLRPDFTSDKNIVIKHDLSEVRALQEDESDKHARIREDFRVGMITREMALRELGYDAELKPDETIMVTTGVKFVTVADALTDPNAEPLIPPPDPNAPNDPNAPPPPAKALQVKRRSEVLRKWPDLLDAMVEMAEPALERDLEQYFDGVRKRAVDAVLNGTTNGVIH